VVFGDGCGLRGGRLVEDGVQSDGVRHALLAGLAARRGAEALARRAAFSVKSVQTPTPPQDLATAGKDALGGGWRRRLATQVWRREPRSPYAEVKR